MSEHDTLHGDTIPATIPMAMAYLDGYILQYMRENTPWGYGPGEWFFHLRCFTTDELTKDTVRGLMRSLTDRGLVEYRSGLVDEDGYLAGAGYGITQKGLDWLSAHETSKEPTPTPTPKATPKGKSHAAMLDGFRFGLSIMHTAMAKPLTEEEAASAALSYRHDYGLLPPLDREALRREAKEWHRALSHRITRQDLVSLASKNGTQPDPLPALHWKDAYWDRPAMQAKDGKVTYYLCQEDFAFWNASISGDGPSAFIATERATGKLVLVHPPINDDTYDAEFLSAEEAKAIVERWRNRPLTLDTLTDPLPAETPDTAPETP